MSLDTLFQLINLAVMPGWILLAVAPRWRWTAPLISGVLLPLLMAVTYLVLLITAPRIEGGGFSSLEKLHTLFQNRHVLVTGWAHYLAFDLFIGSWLVRDSQRLGLAHLWVLPCLFFTLMAGPVGLLLYFGLRAVLRRQLAVSSEQSTQGAR